MSVQYSNNEIDLKFKNLEERLSHFHELQMTELRAIKEQTIKTNGRVNRHDDKIDSLEGGVMEVKGEIKKWLAVAGVLWAVVEIGIRFVI